MLSSPTSPFQLWLLPKEIIVEICHRLPPCSLKAFVSSCKTTRNISNENFYHTYTTQLQLERNTTFLTDNYLQLFLTLTTNKFLQVYHLPSDHKFMVRTYAIDTLQTLIDRVDAKVELKKLQSKGKGKTITLKIGNNIKWLEITKRGFNGYQQEQRAFLYGTKAYIPFFTTLNQKLYFGNKEFCIYDSLRSLQVKYGS